MAKFTDYVRYDALGLADLVATKQATAGELLEAAIERLEAVNPKINAVNLKMYDEAKRSIAAGLPQGPFTGVPFLLKDLGAFYAGFPTSFGSAFYKDFVPDHDTTLVERHRKAGLVVFGKSNTPEFGLAATTEPVAFGPTRNPWNLAISPGGSSGGAAAAVAAGVLPMAHATDGGGSIRIPAAYCGLFGLKPTRARNPAGPDIGEGWSGMASSHCVSISVRDSAALLDATHGPAPGDPYMAPPPAGSYLRELAAGPGRLRIAVMRHSLWGRPLHAECLRGVEATAKLLGELGHVVEEAAPKLDVAAHAKAFRVIIAGNVAAVLELRAGAIGRKWRPDEVEKVSWQFAEEGRKLTAADYALAILAVHAAGRQLAAFFQRYDLLLGATMAEPPQALGAINMMSDSVDDYYEQQLLGRMSITPLFNMTGGPAMSVPLHWSADGLPVGIHFGARHGDEATLFRLAAQLERAKPWAGRRAGI